MAGSKMKLDVVIFTQTDDNRNPTGNSLEINDIVNANHYFRSTTKSLIVFSEDYIERVKAYKNEIDFLGQQNDAVGLTKIFRSKRGKVPLVIGKYAYTQRLIGSVYGYLNKKTVFRNKSLLAVKNDVFQELWQTVLTNSSNIPLPQKSTQEEKVRDSTGDDLSKLLPPMAENPNIEKAYIGSSPDAQFIRQLILRASQNRRPVLILGDSGTGKDVIARQIHLHSEQRDNPFVSINCGAIPSELFESELFGHVKGAFSGAVKDKEGLWETANDGTLFLDEIGDLSLHHQVKILRAIQEGSGRKVGSVHNYPLDARIIAATNKHLYKMVTQGQFREDLYYRLRLGMLIYTSPLRDRKEDIPLMASTFWNRIDPENKHSPRLSKEILYRLMDFQWTGNVRELKSVLNSLHSFFYEVDELSINHLEAILAYEGQDIVAASNPLQLPPKTEILTNKIKTMRQLIRLDEFIEATINDIHPFISSYTESSDPLIIHSQLKNRINELDALCSHPLQFGSSKVFDEVNLLRSKLLYFYDILNQNFESACIFWREEVNIFLKDTRSNILKDLDEMVQ